MINRLLATLAVALGALALSAVASPQIGSLAGADEAHAQAPADPTAPADPEAGLDTTPAGGLDQTDLGTAGGRDDPARSSGDDPSGDDPSGDDPSDRCPSGRDTPDRGAARHHSSGGSACRSSADLPDDQRDSARDLA